MRRKLLRTYLFSARDVVRSIENMEQLQSVAVEVWKHIPNASADTKRKIRRALEEKEAELRQVKLL